MDLKLLPSNRALIRTLDLTENNFDGLDFRFLNEFPSLKSLILDKNKIQSKILMPFMPNLETLWVNHNKIENLSIFIEHLRESAPNLHYLSMLNNAAAPSFFNGGSLIEYNEYRLYVMSKLSKLQMLDSKEITPEERMQSQTIYGKVRTKTSTKKNGNKKKSKQIITEETHSLDKLLPSLDKNKINETKNLNIPPPLIENVLKTLDSQANNEYFNNLKIPKIVQNNGNFQLPPPPPPPPPPLPLLLLLPPPPPPLPPADFISKYY